TEVAEEQPEVTRSPVYRDEPGQSNLLYENDFVLTKTTTDIVVNGTAYAPHGAPAGVVDVAMQIGHTKKILRVFGDRVWEPDGTWISPPIPFVSLPLTYERAFGGKDAKSARPDVDWYWPNPVGTGFVASASRADGLRAPNVEYPNQLI